MQKQYLQLFQKAVNQFKRNNHQQALEFLNKSIQIYPNKYSSYINRGTIYAQLQLDNFALPDFNKAIELDPSDQVGYFNRFTLNLKSGRKLQALQDLYVSLSCINIKKGLKLNEIKYFTKAISLVQNNIFAYIQRGNYYRDIKNSKMALNDYSGAIQIDDTHIQAYIMRANLNKFLKNEKQAILDLKKILELKRESKKKIINLKPILNKKLSQIEIQGQIEAKLRQFLQIRSLIYKAKQRNDISEQFEYKIKQYQSQSPDMNNENEDLSVKMMQLQEDIKMLKKQNGLTKQLNEQKNNTNNSKNVNASVEQQILLEFSNPVYIQNKKQKQPIKKSVQINSFQEYVAQKNQNSKQQQINLLDGSLQLKPNDQKLSQKFFNIQIIESTITRVTQKQNQMSPYVKLIYGKQIKCSRVDINGGKMPQWKQSFRFNLEQSNFVKIEVRDKNMRDEDLIGEGIVSIYQNINKLVLKYDNKPVGIIYLNIELNN